MYEALAEKFISFLTIVFCIRYTKWSSFMKRKIHLFFFRPIVFRIPYRE
jgi:hypothetical protein